MKKRALRIIGLSVILGLGLLAVQIGFKIDSKVLLSYYWKIALVFLLLVLVINFIYLSVYVNNIKNAMLLLEQEKYEEYIQKMENLLNKAKGETLINIIKVNLTAGYIKNNEYQKSLNLLNSIDQSKLKGEPLNLVYAINLAVSYFRLDNFDKFKEVYNLQKIIFDKYQEDGNYGEPIKQLMILNDIVENNYDKALELLEKLKANNSNLKRKQEYDELENIILSKKAG